jgi:uncharacterized membrane protein
MASLKHRLGFSNTRSFIVTSIFASILFFFSTLQLPYIDIDRVFCAEDPWSIPGECYWFKRPGLMRNGMVLHLATFLPAGALVCFQFVPILRRPQYAKFHRVNGYVVLGLSVAGTVGALIISKEAMGGSVSNMIGTWTFAIVFIMAMAKSMIAIKQRKIEEHRAWMLRAWFYVSIGKRKTPQQELMTPGNINNLNENRPHLLCTNNRTSFTSHDSQHAMRGYRIPTQKLPQCIANSISELRGILLW